MGSAKRGAAGAALDGVSITYITVHNQLDQPIGTDIVGHLIGGGEYGTVDQADTTVVNALARHWLRTVTDPGGDLSGLAADASTAILATRAANNGTQPPPPPADPVTIRSFAGDWTSGIGYPAGFAVTNGGGLYLSPAPVPARTTFDPADWMLLLAGGGVGAPAGALDGKLLEWNQAGATFTDGSSALSGFVHRRGGTNPVTAAAMWFNVMDFGAVGDGVTDDAAAIQAAINAAQAVNGSLFFPHATYLHATALQITAPMRITGDNAILLTTGCGQIDFTNTYISAASATSSTIGLEIDHLIFDTTGGHIFDNTNWNKFHVHHCRFIQRSAGFAVWNSTGVGANQLTGLIDNCVFRVYGAARTIEAIHIVSSIGGGLAFVTFFQCLFQNNDKDASHFLIYIEGTGSHNYTNAIKFFQTVFDAAYGGAVKLLSVQGASFDMCTIVDSYGTPAAGNSMYYIGASAGGSQWPSSKVSFRDCNRDLQGPNGSATWDIECEASTDSVVIDTYTVRDITGVSTFYPYFNFHGCTNVTLLNDTGAVVTNPAVSQIQLGPNGNISFSGALSGAAQPNIPLPSDSSLISWSYDPAGHAGNSVPNSGVMVLIKHHIRAAATITDIGFHIATGAAGLTAGENFGALCDANGNVLGQTADLSASLGGTGMKNFSLTAPVAVTAGDYYEVLLFNGTTPPALARGGNNPMGGNDGQGSASTYRFATNGSGLTAIPAQITMASNGAANAPYWGTLR